jgi:formylglycine-generating enzyme required for sulfatase activity
MDYIVHRVLRFDRFTLDLARGCIRVGGQEISLRPKTFDVLCHLAENAGRLVSKQELFKAVWPNVCVCDDSLVQSIRELRQKLGDDDRRLIRTVSRRGYILDTAVSAQAPDSMSDGFVVGLAEEPKAATRLNMLRTSLGAIRAHKSPVQLAAAAGLTCVALGIIYLIGLPLLDANPGHVSFAKNVAAESPSRPTFKDCVDCPEMVPLPAGEFMMGSGEDGLAARRVLVAKPIALGKFEITVDQFSAFVTTMAATAAGNLCRAIVGDNGKPPNSFIMGPPEASFRQPGFAVTAAHPAVCINWHDAHQYVAWLRRRTGKPYRLPSEAEWEYAARAGTQTRYSFGDDVTAICAHARFANVGTSFPWRDGCGSDTAGPIPVGQLKPNPWGLFDMHGNAWE